MSTKKYCCACRAYQCLCPTNVDVPGSVCVECDNGWHIDDSGQRKHAPPLSDLEFKDQTDPEANGRQPQYGECRYSQSFTLEDGRKLIIHMGKEGVANVRKVVMDQFADEQFEINGESTEVIAMLLFCPKCGTQHVDAPEPENGWTNPPHKSHLCHACQTVWRPARQFTNGVASIRSRGSRDTWP